MLSDPRGSYFCFTGIQIFHQGGQSEKAKHMMKRTGTYESKIPNDMGSGSLLSSSGVTVFLEHIVRPESSSYVAFGRRASVVKLRLQ